MDHYSLSVLKSMAIPICDSLKKYVRQGTKHRLHWLWMRNTQHVTFKVWDQVIKTIKHGIPFFIFKYTTHQPFPFFSTFFHPLFLTIILLMVRWYPIVVAVSIPQRQYDVKTLVVSSIPKPQVYICVCFGWWYLKRRPIYAQMSVYVVIIWYGRPHIYKYIVFNKNRNLTRYDIPIPVNNRISYGKLLHSNNMYWIWWSFFLMARHNQRACQCCSYLPLRSTDPIHVVAYYHRHYEWFTHHLRIHR
jgi:hypothetical protein